MPSKDGIPQSAYDRAYDLNFQRKLGELSDFGGRALVAAGVGVGIVAKLAEGKAPSISFWGVAMTIAGFVLIYAGIGWQAAADAEKEHGDA